MRKLLISVLLLVAIQAVPAISEATTTVTIRIDGQIATNTSTNTPASISADCLPPIAAPCTSINNKPSIRIGGTYTSAGKTLTIVRCATADGCSGFAPRVVVDDQPSFDILYVTDPLMSITGGNAVITIEFSSNDFQTVPTNTYPYFVFANGIFVAPPDQNPRNNTISVNGEAEICGECLEQINTGTTGFSPNLFSVFAPPFRTSATADFNKQETVNFSCSNDEGGCRNDLRGVMTVALLSGHAVRLPGSAGPGGINVPTDQGGLDVLAGVLASLHPAAGKARVLKACLTPSPGDQDDNTDTIEIPVRGLGNSQTTWVSSECALLGGGDDDDGGKGTRVAITNGGLVIVTARGLCPVDTSGTVQCQEMNVGVSVFCSDDTDPVVDDPNGLALDDKGNGKAELLVALPCLDPAVLIRESGNLFDARPWIAAIGVP